MSGILQPYCISRQMMSLCIKQPSATMQQVGCTLPATGLALVNAPVKTPCRSAATSGWVAAGSASMYSCSHRMRASMLRNCCPCPPALPHCVVNGQSLAHTQHVTEDTVHKQWHNSSRLRTSLHGSGALSSLKSHHPGHGVAPQARCWLHGKGQRVP